MNLAEYKDYYKGRIDCVDHRAVEDFIKSFMHYTTTFIIGNGGSATLASHLAQDLTKQCKLDAVSLTDSVAMITAMGNDLGYENVFLEQLKIRSQYTGDALLAISGSGNSPNILKAVEWANDHGIWTMGLSGYEDNRLMGIVRQSINLGLNDMETCESIFSFICHYIVLRLK